MADRKGEGNWAAVVQAVKSPLGFFALAILAGESGLVTLAIKLDGRHYIAVLAALYPVFLSVIVCGLAIWFPDALHGRRLRVTRAPMQAEDDKTLGQVQSIRTDGVLGWKVTTVSTELELLSVAPSIDDVQRITSEAEESETKQLVTRPVEKGSAAFAAIEKELRDLAQSEKTDWAKRGAELIERLLSDGGVESLPQMRRFAEHWGWHLANNKGFEPIYNALSRKTTIRFLLAVLRSGRDEVWFGRGRRFAVADELLNSFGSELSGDEKAEAHLARANIHLLSGDHVAARRELSSARAGATSADLQEKIFLFQRRQNFESCREDAIRTSLDEPLLPGVSRCIQFCHRGSDALLLGEMELGRRYWAQALDAAESEDERAAALWGSRLVLDLDSRNSFEADERLRLRLADIDERAAPRLREVESLRRRAGAEALNGRTSEAIEHLRNFLSQGRDSGWSHSGAHNRTGPLEHAALDLVRLLWAPDRSSREWSEGLSVLLRFGLAKQTEKLLHCDYVQRISSDRKLHDRWVELLEDDAGFALRQRDAHRSLAAASIPLLPDGRLCELAVDLSERIARASEDRKLVLDPEWREFVTYSVHLPEAARQTAVRAAMRVISHPDLWPLHLLRLPSEFWDFWAMNGGPPRDLASDFSTTIKTCVGRIVQETNPHWERDVLLVARDIATHAVLSGNDRTEITTVAYRALDSRSHNHGEPIFWLILLEALEEDVGRRVSLAERAAGLYSSVRHSSLADNWCWIAAELVDSAPQRIGPVLFDHACSQASDVLETRRDSLRLMSAASAARLFAASAGFQSTEDVVSLRDTLTRLVDVDVGAAAFVASFPYTDPDMAAVALDAIRRRLAPFANPGDRREALEAAVVWIERGGAIDAALLALIESTTSADDAFVRGIAYRSLRHLLTLGRFDLHGLPKRLAARAVEATHADPDWFVRANAGHALADCVPYGASVEYAASFARLVDDRVAIVRRIGELGQRNVAAKL